MQSKSLVRVGFIFVCVACLSLAPRNEAFAEPAAGVPGVPVRVVIPSIGLNSTVEALGLTKNGEMAVPKGTTDHVGWYKNGVLPGAVGSAVLDAHVFAAFSHLKDLSEGSDIYVVTNSNTMLHFVVTTAKTYALKELSSKTLFGSRDVPLLNLITCAGKLTKDRSTYDHRLVVSAALVNDL